MTNWNTDMAKAPRDGTRVLIRCGDRWEIGWWNDWNGHWQTENGGRGQPVAWAPLPTDSPAPDSLDAAIADFERLLPGWFWSVWNDYDGSEIAQFACAWNKFECVLEAKAAPVAALREAMRMAMEHEVKP